MLPQCVERDPHHILRRLAVILADDSPATDWNSVSVGPGSITSASIPVPRNSPHSPSPNSKSNPLVALYTACNGSGWRPATLPTITTAPRPRLTIPGMIRLVSTTGTTQFTTTIERNRSVASLSKRPA